MVITRTEFDKAMREINEFAVSISEKIEKLENAIKELEEKKAKPAPKG